MSVRKFVVFIVTLLILVTLTALAHPGRTDSNGGHWNRKTGTYHFHTGEYAGKGSSGSSSSSEYVPFTPPYEPPTENPYTTDNSDLAESKWYENKSTWEIVKFIAEKIFTWVIWLWIIGMFLYVDFDKSGGCITISVIIFAVVYFLRKLLTNYLLVTISVVIGITVICFGLYKLYELYNKIDYKGRIYKYENMVNEFVSYVTRYKEKEAEFLEFERIPIPDDCEVKGGLPAEKGASDRWGEKFTVYLSEKGGKVHIVRGCCSVFNERHIYEISQYKNFYYALCKKCGKNYVVPDMLWYENYLQYSELLREVLELSEKIEVFKWRSVDCKKECYTLVIKFILLFDKHSKEQLKEIDKKLKTTIENNQTL